MPRWPARRGQVEPLAALAAVAVLGIALATYAGAHAAASPSPDERERADPALSRALDAVRHEGIVEPTRLDRVPAAPDGYRLRVTLRATDRNWSRGPVAPRRADAATALVPVRTSPRSISPGRLRVEVWRR